MAFRRLCYADRIIGLFRRRRFCLHTSVKQSCRPLDADGRTNARGPQITCDNARRTDKEPLINRVERRAQRARLAVIR